MIGQLLNTEFCQSRQYYKGKAIAYMGCPQPGYAMFATQIGETLYCKVEPDTDHKTLYGYDYRIVAVVEDNVKEAAE